MSGHSLYGSRQGEADHEEKSKEHGKEALST